MPSTNPLLKTSSVQLVEEIKTRFNETTKYKKMSLAKLLNRAMLLYVQDENFQKEIDSFTGVIPYHKEF